MPEQLKRCWLELWRRLEATGDGDTVYRDLSARYSKEGRAYHNLSHIADCLSEFKTLKMLAQRPETIEMAIWFHDAVYDSRAKDNEENSAGLADNVSSRAGIPGEFRKCLKELIMATKAHVSHEDSDAQLLIDIDLSILGRRPEKFEEYERQIRQEYAWVADEAFAAGRAAVLEGFLARPRIYGTSTMFEKYEQTARENLTRSIKQLRGRL